MHNSVSQKTYYLYGNLLDLVTEFTWFGYGNLVTEYSFNFTEIMKLYLNADQTYNLI